MVIRTGLKRTSTGRCTGIATMWLTMIIIRHIFQRALAQSRLQRSARYGFGSPHPTAHPDTSELTDLRAYDRRGPATIQPITIRHKRSYSMKTLTEGVRRIPMRLTILVLSVLALTTSAALAHDVTPGDAG